MVFKVTKCTGTFVYFMSCWAEHKSKPFTRALPRQNDAENSGQESVQPELGRA